MFTRTLLAACLLAIGSMACASGAEDISLDELPEVVAAAILGELGGAPIHELKSITTDDRAVYIAESRIAGRKVELHVSDRGRIVLRRLDIAVSSAPLSVQDALFRYGGQIDDLDRVSGDGDVRYEAEIEVGNDLEIDVVVAEDGTVISEREKRDH